MNRRAGVRFRPERRAFVTRELLVPHGLFETRRLLPEQSLPGREVRALEQRVLQGACHAFKCGEDVNTIDVDLPQLAVVALRRPSEGVARMLSDE